jgi:hypothetical protein
MSRNCTLCGKPIKLTPTAAERAAKFGKTPAFYTNLFQEHAECQVKEWYNISYQGERNETGL